MSLTIILSIVSVIGTISSIVFAYLAFSRNNKHDNRLEGKKQGSLRSDVDCNKSNITLIENKIDGVEKKYFELFERVISLEQIIKNR